MWSKLSICGEVRRKHCGIFLRLCQDEVEQRDPITIEVKVVPRWLSGEKKRISLLMLEMQVQSLVQEDPLESEMATHSSILAWKTPWTEEPGRLQPMTLQRVGHDLAWARWWSLLILTQSFFKIWNVSHEFACHPCAGAMLIFSVSFQYYHMCCQSEHPDLVFILCSAKQHSKGRGLLMLWYCATLYETSFHAVL